MRLDSGEFQAVRKSIERDIEGLPKTGEAARTARVQHLSNLMLVHLYAENFELARTEASRVLKASQGQLVGTEMALLLNRYAALLVSERQYQEAAWILRLTWSAEVHRDRSVPNWPVIEVPKVLVAKVELVEALGSGCPYCSCSRAGTFVLAMGARDAKLLRRPLEVCADYHGGHDLQVRADGDMLLVSDPEADSGPCAAPMQYSVTVDAKGATRFSSAKPEECPSRALLLDRAWQSASESSSAIYLELLEVFSKAQTSGDVRTTVSRKLLLAALGVATKQDLHPDNRAGHSAETAITTGRLADRDLKIAMFFVASAIGAPPEQLSTLLEEVVAATANLNETDHPALIPALTGFSVASGGGSPSALEIAQQHLPPDHPWAVILSLQAEESRIESATESARSINNTDFVVFEGKLAKLEEQLGRGHPRLLEAYTVAAGLLAFYERPNNSTFAATLREFEFEERFFDRLAKLEEINAVSLDQRTSDIAREAHCGIAAYALLLASERDSTAPENWTVRTWCQKQEEKSRLQLLRNGCLGPYPLKILAEAAQANQPLPHVATCAQRAMEVIQAAYESQMYPSRAAERRGQCSVPLDERSLVEILRMREALLQLMPFALSDPELSVSQARALTSLLIASADLLPANWEFRLLAAASVLTSRGYPAESNLILNRIIGEFAAVSAKRPSEHHASVYLAYFGNALRIPDPTAASLAEQRLRSIFSELNCRNADPERLDLAACLGAALVINELDLVERFLIPLLAASDEEIERIQSSFGVLPGDSLDRINRALQGAYRSKLMLLNYPIILAQKRNDVQTYADFAREHFPDAMSRVQEQNLLLRRMQFHKGQALDPAHLEVLLQDVSRYAEPHSPAVQLAHQLLASAWMQNSQPQHALESARAAVAMVSARQELVGTESFPELQRLNAESVGVLLELLVQAADHAEAFRVMQIAEASSVGAAFAKLGSRLSLREADIAEVARQRDDLLARRLVAQQSLISGANPIAVTEAEAGSARATLEVLDQELARVNAVLRARAPNYFNFLQPKALTAAEARSRLAPGEALLAYSQRGTTVWGCALGRDTVRCARIAASAEVIEQLVHAARRSLELHVDGTLPAFDGQPLYALHELLVRPFSAEIAGSSQLVVVADGALRGIPFATLLETPVRQGPANSGVLQGASWLIRRYSISALPTIDSLRLLGVGRDHPVGRSLPFAGFGAPVLTDSGDDLADAVSRGLQLVAEKTNVKDPMAPVVLPGVAGDSPIADVDLLRALPALPGTDQELGTLAAMLGGSTAHLWLGPDATETNLKSQDLARFQVLAFATHGLRAGEIHPASEPGLVLTPPATGSAEDDGLLTASEVAELKLDADLVILSACNSGASTFGHQAEVFSGLARSFVYAGSRSVLASLWPVASDATVELMSNMAQHYRATPDLGWAQAQRLAVLAWLDDSDSVVEAHPGIWGPFVVFGRAVSSDTRSQQP
jgi:CHAT domain-containing protein